ncbi:MAG: guanylate kinase [Verrucomicrobiota bacterium]
MLSAPSGGGKSTLLTRLRPFGDFKYSVSCTTRQPRPGEVNGVDYHFLTRPQFEEEIQKGNLLEWAEVHGNFYGTRLDAVVSDLNNGVDILVDVDVQGAKSIRESDSPVISNALVDVFLTPPSLEILNNRLRSRATETQEQLALRLRNASIEMACWNTYQYLIVSGSAEDDLRQFRTIMDAERLKVNRIVNRQAP